MRYSLDCTPQTSAILIDGHGGFLSLPLSGDLRSRYEGWFVNGKKLLSSIKTNLPKAKTANIYPTHFELCGKDYKTVMLLSPKTLNYKVSLKKPRPLKITLSYDIRDLFGDPRFSQNYLFSKSDSGITCVCNDTTIHHNMPDFKTNDGKWREEKYPLDKSRADAPFSRWVYEKQFSFNSTDNLTLTLSQKETPSSYYRAMTDAQIFTETHSPKFSSSNSEFSRAINFASLNCVSLFSKPSAGQTPWAGLPYFPYPWGRDTSISFPALFALGEFETFKTIADHMCYTLGANGRLANYVDMKKIPQFNAEDATWWFVKSLEDYLDYSGDFKFLNSNKEYLIKIIEGGLSRRDNGLIVHGSNETWMDTPSTPRYKAIETEALFSNALNFAVRIKDQLGLDYSRDAAKAKRQVESYWNGSYLDDGKNDSTLRPNQVIALNLGIGSKKALKSLENLEVPHGILTLDPKDPRFESKDLGVNTGAYHNGDVWPWLTCEYISTLVRFGKVNHAWAFTQKLLDGFNQGAIGHLPEIYDASSQTERGCPSQLWSMAQFIKNAYQDYLGIHPKLIDNEIYFSPSLPDSLKSMSAKSKIGDNIIEFRADSKSAKIIPKNNSDIKTIIWGRECKLSRRSQNGS